MGVLGEDSSPKIESAKRTMMNKMIKNGTINNGMSIDVHINSFTSYNQYDGSVDSELYTFFQEKLKRPIIKNFYCVLAGIKDTKNAYGTRTEEFLIFIIN